MRSLLLSTLGILILLPALPAQEAKAPRVCLVSGSLEYESNKSLPILQARLEKKGAVCSRAFLEGKDISKLPGLENLDKADVMVLFTRRLNLKGDDLERLKRYCLSGKPIVGIRTASHAVQTWLDLDKEVFGGNYTGHFGNETVAVKLIDAQKRHPILAGVNPFETPGSLYKNAKIANDCTVLLTGTSPSGTMPVAWIRDYKGGPIFYTSLGHQKDFENDQFLRLMENAVFWAASK